MPGASRSPKSASLTLAARINMVLLPHGHRGLRELRAQAILGGQAEIRRAAVETLAVRWHDEPDTMPLLRACVRYDADWYVRDGAREALAAGWRDDPDTARWLRERVPDDSPTPAASQRSPGDLHDSGFATVIRDQIPGDDWDTLLTAVRAMIPRHGEAVLTRDVLFDLATDGKSIVLRAAVRALAAGYRDDPHVASVLRDRASNDEHEIVRLAGLRELASTLPDDADSHSLLRNIAIHDREQSVRRAAVEVFARGCRDDVDAFRWLVTTPPRLSTQKCGSQRSWSSHAAGVMPRHPRVAPWPRH